MSTSTVPEAREGETFKAHPVFSWLQVSTDGRVWSTKSKKFVGYESRMGSHNGKRVYGTDAADKPYIRVTVHGGHAPQYVQVLVLETFVGPRPDGHEADHIDTNRLNNRLSNLRWLLEPENKTRHLRSR